MLTPVNFPGGGDKWARWWAPRGSVPISTGKWQLQETSQEFKMFAELYSAKSFPKMR
jgi:hypothetical protein